MTQDKDKDERVPTYRNEGGGEYDEKGPVTRREKLQAWWNHGEIQHPYLTLVAWIVIAFAIVLYPYTWHQITVGTSIVSLLSGLVGIGASVSLAFVGLNTSEATFCRKSVLISSALFLVAAPICKYADPLGMAEVEATRAVEKAEQEAKDTEALEKECKEHSFVKVAPTP